MLFALLGKMFAGKRASESTGTSETGSESETDSDYSDGSSDTEDQAEGQNQKSHTKKEENARIRDFNIEYYYYHKWLKIVRAKNKVSPEENDVKEAIAMPPSGNANISLFKANAKLFALLGKMFKSRKVSESTGTSETETDSEGDSEGDSEDDSECSDVSNVNEDVPDEAN